MNNRISLTDMLGQVDGSFLDEYCERRRNRSIKRKMIIKYCGIAASFVIVIALSFAVALLPMLKDLGNNPPVLPPESVPCETDKGDINASKPGINNKNPNLYTVIYAKEGTSINFESFFQDPVEETTRPDSVLPQKGNVVFNDELSEIMANPAPYENSLFAVMISFSSNNNSQGNTEEAEEQYLKSMNLETKSIKVILGKELSEDCAATGTYEVKICRLTKEQLKELTAPDNLNIEFTLIPEWMDSGKTVILYPAAQSSSQ